jgi:hypothetical protein
MRAEGPDPIRCAPPQVPQQGAAKRLASCEGERRASWPEVRCSSGTLLAKTRCQGVRSS